MQGGYAIIAKAALADLITYTQSPQAIEAYGYVVGQIAAAWAGNSAGMAAAYEVNPMWDVMPRLPDGKYLAASQMQIDTSNSSTVTLTASGGDALLAVVGGGTATLTGGSGGTDLLFGGSGPTTLIAGTGNDYLFAGAGATTFIDNKGNDYMKGGPAADTFTFADVNSGHDTIVSFKAGTDVLKIASNLNGNGIRQRRGCDLQCQRGRRFYRASSGSGPRRHDTRYRHTVDLNRVYHNVLSWRI